MEDAHAVEEGDGKEGGSDQLVGKDLEADRPGVFLGQELVQEEVPEVVGWALT